MLLEQLRDGEREEGRHERSALLDHVAAVDDRREDRRVRGRPSDPPVLERLDEGRLGVPRGRRRLVALGLERERLDGVAGLQVRQGALLVVERGVVAALLVRRQEAAEGDHRSTDPELGVLAGCRGCAEPERDGLPARVSHLRGDGALPDELVERLLVAVELAAHLVGEPEPLAGGPDRLVRLLRVLDLAVVLARGAGNVVGTVELLRLRPRGVERCVGQRRRVGAHVRDVAALVQALGDAHRRLRREAELAARLLLERRRHERGRRPPRVRLLVHRANGERGSGEPVGQAPRLLLRELADIRLQLPVRAEVAPLRDPLALEGDEARSEPAGVEQALEVPVRGRDERHPLALALDDEPRGDGLDPACGQPRHHLLPEHRRDLVAVEPIEDPPRLLRVDEPLVDRARVVERSLDRLLGDLVEDHPVHGHLRLQLLEQVPGDRLALSVFVRREQQLVGILQLPLQVGDDALLVRVDDVVRLEALVDRNAHGAVPFPLFLRDLRGALRQITDVTDAGLDDEVGPEVAGDGLGLRRRLDDDELL